MTACYSMNVKELQNSYYRHWKIFGNKLSLIVLGVIMITTVAGYLVQVNLLAAKGFQIKDLENNIYSLKDDNAKLQIQMIELQTMTSIQKRIEELKMVPVDKLTYYGGVGAGEVLARR